MDLRDFLKVKRWDSGGTALKNINKTPFGGFFGGQKRAILADWRMNVPGSVVQR